MDIPGMFQKGAATAFALADSAMIDAVLSVNPSATITIANYSSVTGAATVTPTSYNVRGLMYQSRVQKMAQDSAELAMFMIEAEKARAMGLTIDPADCNAFLTIQGVRFHVTAVDFDPASALYIFNLRVS
jgi:hypothetical protein